VLPDNAEGKWYYRLQTIVNCQVPFAGTDLQTASEFLDSVNQL